ncbi:MAG: hypothetical protein IH988_07040 [Planctomycetes bacterium]|nr:hypothetical protein [Planctomycetota bacterium]
MVIQESELRRLQSDPTRLREMVGEVYCASCGYCLKTLPYFGRCPECGSTYNAQSLNMTGIYTSHYLRPPIGLAFGTLVSLAIGASLLVMAARDRTIWWIGFGAFFSVTGLLYLRLLLREAGRFLRSRSVEKMIEQAKRERE